MPKRSPKKTASKTPAAPVDLSYIAEDLRPLAVPIDTLKLDERNANTHDERNVSAIAASMRSAGVVKPIVVQVPGNIVRAGEGAVLAARANGWTHLPAVRVQFRDDNAATGFAIADNRTAELSEWNEDRLKELLADIEWDDLELARMADDLLAEIDADAAQAVTVAQTSTTTLPGDDDEPAAGDAATSGGGDPDADAGKVFKIVVECGSEQQQAELLERFAGEGLTCRALRA
jgi:ParB-like chromosome segregation protein Spo0J